MLSSWVSYPSIAALPEHCEPTTPFLATISSFLHVCLPTHLALLSTFLGMMSIFSWLNAQIPQIYKNYSIKSTAGLSVWFLVEWCLGDSGNLIGAVLTNQAGWQITIASYYVLVDIIMVFQYYWYTYIKEWQLPRFGYILTDEESGDESEGTWNGELLPESTAHSQLTPTSTASPNESKAKTPQNTQNTDNSDGNSPASPNEKKRTPSRTIQRAGARANSPAPLGSPRTLLLVTLLCAVLSNAASLPDTRTLPSRHHHMPVTHDSPKVIAGRIASWVSTFMYLGSRLPQIFKNHKRKSTAGLSPLLFFAAFCGNFFYSSSLLTNPNAWFDFPAYGGGGWAGPEGNDRFEWITRALPFWLGAAGVLLLDGTVGVQFLMYAQKHEELVIKIPGEGRGRRRWKRVTGWMRGWIPSTSPERDMAAVSAVVAAENQALLASRERGTYGGV